MGKRKNRLYVGSDETFYGEGNSCIEIIVSLLTTNPKPLFECKTNSRGGTGPKMMNFFDRIYSTRGPDEQHLRQELRYGVRIRNRRTSLRGDGSHFGEVVPYFIREYAHSLEKQLGEIRAFFDGDVSRNTVEYMESHLNGWKLNAWTLPKNRKNHASQIVCSGGITHPQAMRGIELVVGAHRISRNIRNRLRSTDGNFLPLLKDGRMRGVWVNETRLDPEALDLKHYKTHGRMRPQELLERCKAAA